MGCKCKWQKSCIEGKGLERWGVGSSLRWHVSRESAKVETSLPREGWAGRGRPKREGWAPGQCTWDYAHKMLWAEVTKSPGREATVVRRKWCGQQKRMSRPDGTKYMYIQDGHCQSARAWLMGLGHAAPGQSRCNLRAEQQAISGLQKGETGV